MHRYQDELDFAWKMPDRDAGTKFIRGADQDIVWEAGEWGLLAPSPDWFRGSAQVTAERPPEIKRPLKGFEMMQGGVIAPVPLVGTRLWEVLLEFLGNVTLVGICIALPIIIRPFQTKAGSKGL